MTSKRVVAIFLAIFAFVIFCCGPLCQSASAVVGVDDALIAILIAALAACGITFMTTGGYRGLNELVAAELQACAESRGTTVGNLIKGCKSGTNTLGQLLLNNRFVILIDTFAKFIQSKYGVTAGGTVVIQQQGYQASGGINVFECGKCPFWVKEIKNGMGENWVYTWENPSLVANQYLYIVLLRKTSYPQTRYVYAISQYAWTTGLDLKKIKDGDIIHAEDIHLEFTATESGWGYAEIGVWSGTGNIGHFNGSDLPENTISVDNFLYALNDPEFKVITNDGLGIKGGSVILPPLDSPNYTDGDGAILDVGAPWGATYNDVVGGIIPDDWSQGKEGEAGIDYEGTDTVEEQIDDTGETEVISSDPAEYAVSGLTSVFPFCIPFDVYAFVSALAAEPEAPSFTWRFYVPNICDETIEIDLSAFDAVARILRTIELLLFCVGLALETRKIIRG